MDALKHPQAREATSRLGMILGHPLRLRCWNAIAERGTASPNELKTVLGADLQDVSYHVRVLEKYDVIELADTKQRRGATEHFYRITQRPISDDKDTAQRSLENRLMVARYSAQLAFADAALALEDGIFCARPDHCIVRQPVLLDEEGWKEVNAAYQEVVTAVDRAAARSAERMGPEPGPGSGIRATAISLFFERPGAA